MKAWAEEETARKERDRIAQEEARRRFEESERARKAWEAEQNTDEKLEQRRRWELEQEERHRDQEDRFLSAESGVSREDVATAKRKPPRWKPGLGLEAGGGLKTGVLEASTASSQRVFVGGTVAGAVSWRSRYNSDSLGGDDGFAPFIGVLTLGITAIPYSGWVGNDRGLRIRGDMLWAGDDESSRTVLMLEPIARVVPQSGRWRAPSAVQVLTPSIGMELYEGAQNFVLAWPSMSFGWMLDEHLAAEVSFRGVYRRLDDGWSASPQLTLEMFVFD